MILINECKKYVQCIFVSFYIGMKYNDHCIVQKFNLELYEI